jgi:hypothetical protein
MISFVGDAVHQATALHHSGMTALCTSTMVKLLKTTSAKRGLQGACEKVAETLKTAQDDSLEIPPSLQCRATELLQSHAPHLIPGSGATKPATSK